MPVGDTEGDVEGECEGATVVGADDGEVVGASVVVLPASVGCFVVGVGIGVGLAVGLDDGRTVGAEGSAVGACEPLHDTALVSSGVHTMPATPYEPWSVPYHANLRCVSVSPSSVNVSTIATKPRVDPGVGGIDMVAVKTPSESGPVISIFSEPWLPVAVPTSRRTLVLAALATGALPSSRSLAVTVHPSTPSSAPDADAGARKRYFFASASRMNVTSLASMSPS